MISFKRLTLNGRQQFENIDIDFHNRLTILTGANGSGKTTILGSILSRHCGRSFQSGSIPKKDNSGVWKFITNLFIKGKDGETENTIGSISYSNKSEAKLQVPNSNSAQYNIQISNQQPVDCLFVPSHRSVFKYEQVNNIPVGRKNKNQAYQEVSNATRDRYFGNSNQSSSIIMKNTLIGRAIQGYGNEIMDADVEQIKFFNGFQNVLTKIFPKSLGFQKLEIRNMEILFVCNDKRDEFIFEQSSGGISALIDIAWQIYMYTTTDDKEGYTVIIDEIENHLHPTMQRQILPDLLTAFPNVNFIVSTHSPLVVSSVKDSNIYVLKYNDNKKIISSKIDFINQPKTATEILDQVLGVSFTMPIWVEIELNKIIQKYSNSKISDTDIGNMRIELNDSGLERFFPDVIYNIAKTENEKNN